MNNMIIFFFATMLFSKVNVIMDNHCEKMYNDVLNKYIYTKVDVKPLPPPPYKNFNDYIADKFILTKEMKRQGFSCVSGIFIVDEKGYIDVKSIKSMKKCGVISDKSFYELIKNIPKCTPAKCENIDVPSQVVVAIKFN